MVNPTIVEREPTTVVGIETHYDGDESVFGDLWAEFGERWEELEGLACSDEAFGVMTNFEPGSSEFDYVVGVEASDAAAVPDEFVRVDVPGGRYARFETSLGSFESDYEEVTERWLPGSKHDRATGHEFELYGREFDAEDPNSRYDYFVPVENEE